MSALRVLIVGGVLALPVTVALASQAGSSAASGPSRPDTSKFYKDWTMEDLLPSVADLGSGHDWNQGRDLFRRAACGVCHAFGNESEGTGLAPDLTAVGSKLTRDLILQSIIEPSATINGQYFHTSFTLKDGAVVTGSVIDVVAKKIILAPVMLTPHITIEIAESDVKSEQPSPISPMPAGLINEFTKEQVIELLAFLDSGGNRNASVYQKR